MARAPPARRTQQHYRRDNSVPTSHPATSSADKSSSPMVGSEGAAERALSPQLDAALHAAAAVETAEQQQATKI